MYNYFIYLVLNVFEFGSSPLDPDCLSEDSRLTSVRTQRNQYRISQVCNTVGYVEKNPLYKDKVTFVFSFHVRIERGPIYILPVRLKYNKYCVKVNVVTVNTAYYLHTVSIIYDLNTIIFVYARIIMVIDLSSIHSL